MKKQIIEKEITIKASPQNVWRVFTDPVVTRQMGGEYVSDWKAGSDFGWKGPDGTMYTHGKILQIEPGKLLQHKLFDMKDKQTLLSVITYRFEGDGDITLIKATEELNYALSDEALAEAVEGWDYALEAVKAAAEKM